MNKNLPNLTSEITVRGKLYKNRICAAPVGASASPPNGEIPDFIVDSYRRTALGGCASVCVGEHAAPGIYADRLGEFPATDYTKTTGPQSDGWRKYSRTIKESGALALIELAHGGCVRDIDDDLEPAGIGPVDYIREDGKHIGAMDEKMMREVADDFGVGAAYMKTCGFDGILIHAGHGWLLHQFLSTTFNTRTDEYGGSAENRARFPIMVMRRIREYVGEDFIIELRVSCSEVTFDGLDREVLLELAKGVEGYVDIMHFSSGLYNDPHATRMWSTMYDDHFCNMPVAEYIKKNTKNLLVSVVGGINSPEDADRYIGEGRIDFVALGRQVQNADVDFANKCMCGREDDINRCLRCLQCGGGGMPSDPEAEEPDLDAPATGFGSPNKSKGGPPPAPADGDAPPPRREPMGPKCTVNPMANTDHTFDTLPKAEVSKNVLVIGGGITGLTAAYTAAKRGHRVTLAEKNDRLGGILLFTDSDPHKADLKNYRDLMIRRVMSSDIRVMTGTKADEKLIAEVKPDVILCSVGSSPVTPRIPGIENAEKALDWYFGKAEPGKEVVMVGGGLVGCETALALAELGHKVEIVEMLPRVASDTNDTHRLVIRRKFRDMGVKYSTRCRVTEIRPDGVCAEDADGNAVFFPADSVLYAVGMRANSDTVSELKAAAGNIPFVTIGDCEKPSRVGQNGVAAVKAAIAI